MAVKVSSNSNKGTIWPSSSSVWPLARRYFPLRETLGPLLFSFLMSILMTSFIHTASSTTYMAPKLLYYPQPDFSPEPQAHLSNGFFTQFYSDISVAPKIQHIKKMNWSPILFNTTIIHLVTQARTWEFSLSHSLPTKHRSVNPGDSASINFFHICPCYILSAVVWGVSMALSNHLSSFLLIWCILHPHSFQWDLGTYYHVTLSLKLLQLLYLANAIRDGIWIPSCGI